MGAGGTGDPPAPQGGSNLKLFLWLAAAAAAATLIFAATRQPQRHIDSIAPRVSSQEEQDALDGLKLDYRSRKVGFGSVLEIDITVKNTSVYAVKDIEVACNLFGNSGTPVGEVRQTIYELVTGETTTKFPQVNFGLVEKHAQRVNCRIENAKLFR